MNHKVAVISVKWAVINKRIYVRAAMKSSGCVYLTHEPDDGIITFNVAADGRALGSATSVGQPQPAIITNCRVRKRP